LEGWWLGIFIIIGAGIVEHKENKKNKIQKRWPRKELTGKAKKSSKEKHQLS
jgi:hypothetical protein